MLIRMEETRRGSEGSYLTRKYVEGNVYDIADSLAREFLANGWAEEFEGSLAEAFKALSASERHSAEEAEDAAHATPYYAAAAAYAHAATLALRSEQQKQGEK